MLVPIIILVAIIVVFLIAKSLRTTSPDIIIAKIVQDACAAHKVTIARKVMRTVRTDEYGVTHSDASAEIEYFAKHVIFPLLRKEGITDADIDDVVRMASSHLSHLTTTEDMIEVMGAAGFRDDIDGVGYERFISTILTELGWTVTDTAVTGDQGVDLLATKGDRRVAVQCKRYTNSVGNKAVQEAASGAQHYSCNEAWVVTNSTYTPSAERLAMSTGVLLLHHDQLESA